MKKHPVPLATAGSSYQWAKNKCPQMVLFKNKQQSLLLDLSCTPDKVAYDD